MSELPTTSALTTAMSSFQTIFRMSMEAIFGISGWSGVQGSFGRIITTPLDSLSNGVGDLFGYATGSIGQIFIDSSRVITGGSNAAISWFEGSGAWAGRTLGLVLPITILVLILYGIFRLVRK